MLTSKGTLLKGSAEEVTFELGQRRGRISSAEVEMGGPTVMQLLLCEGNRLQSQSEQQGGWKSS